MEKVEVRFKNGIRLMGRACADIAIEHFGGYEVQKPDKPIELKKKLPPEVTKPIPLKTEKDIVYDLVPKTELTDEEKKKAEDQKKLEAQIVFKKEYGSKNKEELQSFATEKNYPKTEWEKLTKAKLLNYLIEKS
jgi:hypothetical protein